VVVEQNRELVEKLREQGVQAVAGDAADRRSWNRRTSRGRACS
jgi:hypothetical protein